LRFFLSGAMLILVMSLLQRRVLVPADSSEVKMIVEQCLSQTIVQYSAFYIGLANTTGVSSSIIKGTNALSCVLVAALVFRQEKLTVQKVLGCILGFFGVLVMNLGSSAYQFHPLGEGLLLFSTFAYAVSSCFLHGFSRKMDPAKLSGWQFFIGGLFLMVLGKLLGGTLVFSSAASVWLLLYLAFLSAAAFTIWGLLLKYNPVSRITVFSFTTTVFGVLLSALLLHESILDRLGRIFLALVLIVIGIFTVQGRWKQLFHNE